MTELRQKWRRGFSLVEVCLALLVIGLGLLAVFGLFPSGLAMSKQSIDETQCAMFANDVFDAYRGYFSADPNLWPLMGGASVNDDIGLGATAGFAWDWSGAGITVKVVRATDPYLTVIYTNYQKVAENAWRYRLTFDDVPGRVGRIKYAHLSVLYGEYGRSNNIQEFYTEFYNFRSPRFP